MKTPSETILWGKIVKTHGVKGEVLAEIFSEDTSDYEDMESVFVVIKQKPIPFFITSYQVTNQSKVILSFEDVSSIKEAEAIVGAELLIPIEELSDADEGRLFFKQIEGYRIDDEQLGELGVVSDFIQKTIQDILVMEYQGHSIMFPAVEPIVKGIDHRKKKVFTNLPDGLLDIYLQQNGPQDDGMEESEDED